MAKRKFLIAPLSHVLLLLLLCGCPYESEVPLSAVSEAKIDKELIGKWQLGPENEWEKSGTLTFFPFNEREFVVVIGETKNDQVDGNLQVEDNLMKAFVTAVGTARFLNAKEIGPATMKENWYLARYYVSSDVLTLQVVEDELFKQKFTTSNALRTFLKNNLNKKELYNDNEGVTLKRVTKRN